LFKDFLANNNVTILEHPPHSPDLAPADVYLFPQLKLALKRWVFGDTTDIIENSDRRAEKAVKIASRKVSNTFTVAGRSVQLHKVGYFEGYSD
jgi:hypothetical protein